MHDGPARHRQHVPDVAVRSSRPLPAEIMVPLGTVTLVEQPVLHLLARHQPFPLDDQRWVHDARCPAPAPPAHSGWSPHVRCACSCVWMVPMDVP